MQEIIRRVVLDKDDKDDKDRHLRHYPNHLQQWYDIIMSVFTSQDHLISINTII